jgi:hypothetical protein
MGWLCQSEVGGETLVLLSGLAVLPWSSTWQDLQRTFNLISSALNFKWAAFL